MPRPDASSWLDAARHSLSSYADSLLRAVAARLVKPRGHWPREDLIDRCIEKLTDAAVIDRRLKELDKGEHRLLALMAHSRQPRWRLGNLVEMLIALGQEDGLRPVLTLMETGLLFPVLPAESQSELVSFEHWLGLAAGADVAVFTHPQVASRMLGTDLGLPVLPSELLEKPTPIESDGLEWCLRLAVVWQLVIASPLRRTQQGEFFKRDLDRLLQDPLLNAPAAEGVLALPEAGILAAALAQGEGILENVEGELRAGELPAAWDEGLPAALASLYAFLPELQSWTIHGRRAPGSANPHPSAFLLSLLLLAQLPEDRWLDPEDIDAWLTLRHPFWSNSQADSKPGATGIATLLLGLAHQLKIVQACKKDAHYWVVRLTSTGRWLLGLAGVPPGSNAYPQTILVQPNLEIVVYRQGLTPALIGKLTRFATWKSLGSACMLQLEAESVYRGLESGQTFETIQRTLEQHGMRPTPSAVIESLRTWANKRERITIYPAAALFEFGSAEDLNEALARGLPGTRLSDRIAVVPNEAAVDFRHFRLTGTRDYGLPPEKCVEVLDDGVTLSVDLVKSDLLLETELQRFAEPIDLAGVNGRRRFRLSPASLAGGREGGLDLSSLEQWFQQRAGQPLSPAARLILLAPQLAALPIRRQLVLHVSTVEIADGLLQWPGTRGFISERLGPTALALDEANLEEFQQRLQALSLTWNLEDPVAVNL